VFPWNTGKSEVDAFLDNLMFSGSTSPSPEVASKQLFVASQLKESGLPAELAAVYKHSTAKELLALQMKKDEVHVKIE
jgi:hypothetical protein